MIVLHESHTYREAYVQGISTATYSERSFSKIEIKVTKATCDGAVAIDIYIYMY